MEYQKPLFRAIAVAVLTLVSAQGGAQESIDEIVVWGSKTDDNFANPSPTNVINQDDIVSINVATTEDVVKFEPSVVIRRRFIGDANGVLGMRGSNMFQTSRSMVFADGVPLH